MASRPLLTSSSFLEALCVFQTYLKHPYSIFLYYQHLVIQETKTTLIINIYKTNLEDSYFSTSLKTHLGNFQGNIEIKFLDFRLLMEPCFSLTHNVTHTMIAMVLTLEPKPHFQYSGCLGLGS